MKNKELCAWLRANSSGVYRPAADAADEIERLASAAFRFAKALSDYMDGEKDHDIQSNTGLPQKDCDVIAAVRAEAMAMVYGMPNVVIKRLP